MILSDLDNIAYNKFANGEITLAEYIKYQNRDKIMDYEQKYKEALARAKEMCVLPTDKATMEYIFPELAESEDKRIKREILELVSIAGNGNQFEAIKDWLEKQGNKLDADKVIEWLKTHGNLVPNVTIKINEVIEKFKKDFKLC